MSALREETMSTFNASVSILLSSGNVCPVDKVLARLALPEPLCSEASGRVPDGPVYLYLRRFVAMQDEVIRFICAVILLIFLGN